MFFDPLRFFTGDLPFDNNQCVYYSHAVPLPPAAKNRSSWFPTNTVSNIDLFSHSSWIKVYLHGFISYKHQVKLAPLVLQYQYNVAFVIKYFTDVFAVTIKL